MSTPQKKKKKKKKNKKKKTKNKQTNKKKQKQKTTTLRNSRIENSMQIYGHKAMALTHCAKKIVPLQQKI